MQGDSTRYPKLVEEPEPPIEQPPLVPPEPIVVPPEPEPPVVTHPEPVNALAHELVFKQLDDNGRVMKLDDGSIQVIGKGRFYLFKAGEREALEKKEQFLWGPNIEVSAEIKVDEVIGGDEKKFINLGGPTNHFTTSDNNSNGRNYSIVMRFDRNGVGFKKETIHGVYDEYETRNTQQELGKWYNLRYKQTVLGTNKIQLDGWIKDAHIGTYIDTYMDDGAMTKDTTKTKLIVISGDRSALYYPIRDAKQVWTVGAYSGLYIRLTGTVKTYIKNVTIKQL